MLSNSSLVHLDHGLYDKALGFFFLSSLLLSLHLYKLAVIFKMDGGEFRY